VILPVKTNDPRYCSGWAAQRWQVHTINRLTRSRDALVVDRPGVTRDRLYGRGILNHQHFLVVDTAGFNLGKGHSRSMSLIR
jgi:hypothetical protein